MPLKSVLKLKKNGEIIIQNKSLKITKATIKIYFKCQSFVKQKIKETETEILN